jgi:hypothetical protein
LLTTHEDSINCDHELEELSILHGIKSTGNGKARPMIFEPLGVRLVIAPASLKRLSKA